MAVLFCFKTLPTLILLNKPNISQLNGLTKCPSPIRSLRRVPSRAFGHGSQLSFLITKLPNFHKLFGQTAKLNNCLYTFVNTTFYFSSGQN